MLKGDGVVAVDAKYDIEDIEYELNKTIHHDMLLNFVLMGTVISTKDEQLAKIPQPILNFDLATSSHGSVVIDPTGYGDPRDN